MDAVFHDTAGETAPGDLKRIRKGTRSCVECRQRKIRCLWENQADSVCTSCKARGRRCVPQLFTRRTTNPNKVSSRDRIARLEAQLANITATVQNKPHSSPGVASPKYDHAGEATSDHDSDTDDPTMQEGPAAFPEHLRLLFDNALIGPDERSISRVDEETPAQICSARYMDAARVKLQQLMPSRDDVATVSSYAVPWMSLYYELFPSTSTTPNRDEMVDKHEHMLKSDADPVQIASFLMTFAITARQLPKGNGFLQAWGDAHRYVKVVMATVDAVIISHAGIASTIEGISVSVLFLRLQLGLGHIRPLWLTLRRTVALAELSGLPRAWYSAQSSRTKTNAALFTGFTDKVYLWESICATDRLASMMFNLPAATTTHKFPRKQVLDANGSVLVQPYMFEQSGIALRVSELDDGYMLGHPDSEAYEKVLAADTELRVLKSLTPPDWWQESAEYLSGAMLVQYWHYYLTTRIHLHAAMTNDAHNLYAYSRTACLDACLSLARRYSYLRRALPAGFFVCRIVDMQVFTAAVYLVLSSYEHGPVPTSQGRENLACVDRIVDTMDHVSKQVGSEFALQAAAALRGLAQHLGSSRASDAPSMTLRVPLIGSIHVGRKTGHGQLGIPESSNNQALQTNGMPRNNDAGHLTADQTTHMGAYNTADCYQPWMQLDMNSSFQDPYLADDWGDLDQWMGIAMANTMPMISDMDVFNEAMRHA